MTDERTQHCATIKAATHYRRTSWKLVGNPGFQLVANKFATFLGCQPDRLSRHAGWQLAAQVECRKRPDLQQVAN